MGRLGRGALWVTFWPAGALASVRAGRRKDTDRIVAAINGKAQSSQTSPVEQSASQIRRREEQEMLARVLERNKARKHGPHDRK